MSKSPTKPPTKPPSTKPIEKAKSGEPAAAPRTKTLPESERGAWWTGPDTVTALAVDGEESVYELPHNKSTISVGSAADQDVVLMSRFVSRQHCVIERRGLKAFVRDLGSRNGTVIGDRVETEFEIRPGERFVVGGVRLVALNESQRAQLPIVAQIVCREAERVEKGGKERPGPLDVLAIAMSTEHVLITGESGCDHDRLARAIHTMSLRRAHDLVQINSVPNDRAGQRKLIDSASRSTLILEITDAMQPLDATFVSMLMSPSYHVRVIVLASTTERASAVLGAEAVKRMTEIHLRPVAFRPSAILWLADATLRERGATLQVSDLTAANRHALESYEWPGNLRELRQVADWLITVEKCGSIRAAAEQLNVPRTTLARALAKIGLTVPLTRHGRGVDAR